MKKAIVYLALAVAWSFAAAQDQTNVVVPESSIERPGDIGLRMHTNYFMSVPNPGVTPDSPPPATTVETPGSIACIYSLVSPTAGCPVTTATTVPTTGSGVIVIVDAYDDPSAGADLKTFSTQFGLPAPSFTKVYASGTKPPNACVSGWEGEEALDIQWAHAMAPKAKIVLMEAASNSSTDLFSAVLSATAYIGSHGGKGEISMSWGSSEYSTEGLNDVFLTGGGYNIALFASSGDSAGVSYPSASPWVVSSGGTQIQRNSSGNYVKQVGNTNCGAGCGGGVSAYEGRPMYQNVVKSVVGSARGTPDISSDSSSKSPVWVYDSSCYNSWLNVWGTSVASPTLAGIINSAGLFELSANEQTEIYNNYTNAADYTDITSGSCSTHSAKVGYDLCTGVGVVKGYGKK